MTIGAYNPFTMAIRTKSCTQSKVVNALNQTVPLKRSMPQSPKCDD